MKCKFWTPHSNSSLSTSLPSNWWEDSVGDPTEHFSIYQYYDASLYLDHLKSKQKDDLDEGITDEIWTLSIEMIHTAFMCQTEFKSHLKIFHRPRLSQSTLVQHYPGTKNPTYQQCNQAPAAPLFIHFGLHQVWINFEPRFLKYSCTCVTRS